ncbi:MAG: MutS-related protein [Brevinematia bacterium]
MSLLWPEDKKEYVKIDESVFTDLELEKIVSEISKSPYEIKLLKEFFTILPLDEKVIKYRQDILDDFLGSEKLTLEFERIVTDFESINAKYIYKNENSFYEFVDKVCELESFTKIIKSLKKIFSENTVGSEGLKRLKSKIEEISLTDEFKNLEAEIFNIADKMRGVKSIAIGINLDNKMHPVEAALIAVNKEKYIDPSQLFLGKLFSNKSEKPLVPITKLHAPPLKEGYGGVKLDPDIYGYAVEPILLPLFNDLHQITEKIYSKLNKQLKNYKIDSTFLKKLYPELLIYLRVVDFIKKYRNAGLTLTKPEIMNKNEKVIEVKDSYNMNLAINMYYKKNLDELVFNDILLNSIEGIIILTGPNQGGKTVYTQSIGITQIFFQLGLFVPGGKAKLSPVDGIFTHFQVEENINRGTGRFGDEAIRIREIFETASENSLILMNEPFSSTNPSESIYLLKEVLKAFAILGTRVVVATHFHDIAERIEDIRGRTIAVSYIATVNKEDENFHKRLYKVIKSKPEGISYAIELAKKYGLNFEELKNIINRKEGKSNGIKI